MKKIECPNKPYEPSKYNRSSTEIVVDSYEEVQIPDGAKSIAISANTDYHGCVESYDVTFYKEDVLNPNYEEQLKEYNVRLTLYELNLKLYQNHEAESKRKSAEFERKLDENEFERLRIKLGK